VTASERQAAAARVLVALEPEDRHAPSCGTGTCHPRCQVLLWARHRAKALDEAGLFCALHEATS
jgi:hypothetical protein